MQELLEYLQNCKEAAKQNFSNCEYVHVVIGNESCDLDSTVSSILLGFFIFKQKQLNSKSCTLACTITPILNVSFENFALRTEIVFALKEIGVEPSLLTYRDEIDLQSLVKSKPVTVSLVDHHILSKHDEILENFVEEIFDHRPIDPSNNWNQNKVKLVIEPVGSCSTLIANEIIKVNIDMLPKKVAYLLYETIIYDTIALLPENGKAKELDIKMGESLEKHFGFTEERKSVFEKLWTAHTDISHLTPAQLLLKDLKVVNGTYIPGLPMLVQDYLKLENSLGALQSFMKKNGIYHLVLVGLEAKGSVVKRDMGFYWINNGGKQFVDILLCKLKNSEKLKGYNFEFSEIDTDFENIILLNQNNTRLSRKQLVPIIKDAVSEMYKPVS